MSDPILLLADGGNTTAFSALAPHVIRSAADARRAYGSDVYRHGRWVAYHVGSLRHLTAVTPRVSRTGRLLVLKPIPTRRRVFVDTIFAEVIAPVERDKTSHLLSTRDLVAVFSSPNADDLFIGGDVDTDDRIVVLYRGNLRRIAVPFEWFKSIRGGPKPDFRDFEVTDTGQTIRAGQYEAAADAILYEFDPDARRRMKEREIESDPSFGGCLRRLRLQKGVGRNDFPGIDAKTIARIERGQVEKPHEDTLKAIAQRLSVDVDEIATY